jgi:hypothetical protein
MKRRPPEARPFFAPPRGGLLDLLLVAAVLFTTWTRTPVGNLTARTVAWTFGWEHSEPALTSYYRVDRAWERVAEHLAQEVPPPPPPPPGQEGLPEPWRSAAAIVLGNEAIPEIDEAWDGDPEEALEIAALGADARDRAIRRAQAAGYSEPETYRGHRDWLSEEERVVGDEAVEGVLAVGTLLAVQWPVEGEWLVSSPFGPRNHPITGEPHFHNGVDLAVPVGTPVVAAQEGEVAAVEEDGRSGKYVAIEHGNGVRTAYCHMDSIDVAVGEKVPRGKRIGASGNTGRSTGPHLHFIVKVHGTAIDPLPLRPAGPRT